MHVCQRTRRSESPPAAICGQMHSDCYTQSTNRSLAWVSDMYSKTVVIILAVTAPYLSFAQGSESYQCTYGELQRRVEIYTEPGVSVPCEVHYYKDTEAPGEPRVLWRAASDASYCQQKTAEFIDKLASWGWSCGQNKNAPADAEPAPEAAPISTPEDDPIPAEIADELPFLEDTESGDEE